MTIDIHRLPFEGMEQRVVLIWFVGVVDRVNVDNGRMVLRLVASLRVQEMQQPLACMHEEITA